MHVSSIIRASGIVSYGSLGPLRNEELSCDYHQLYVRSLSPSEREESSKQLRPRSISEQVHIPSTSQYASCCHIVRKKDGIVRIVYVE